MKKVWKLNTSNLGKFEEFKRLFAKFDFEFETTHIDLKEIDSDPIQVIIHKASQMENVLVEDTSLDIEGASVGVNIRWLLDHLNEYAGRKAEWTVLLAYREEDQVYIYKGSISGAIVLSKGIAGFGFDPVFLPTGATKTLAESKPDAVNARAKAVEALIKGDIFANQKMIRDWNGPWQTS